MQGQATQRRKGAGTSGTGINTTSTTTTTTTVEELQTVPLTNPGGNSTTHAVLGVSSSPLPLATVKRRKFGTSPFDENWLNMDCCGLFCALVTYLLHFYGIYTVCWILLPPWMSYSTSTNATTEGNHNQNHHHHNVLSMWGHMHRTTFALIGFLACWSHFKAMTTDPGAVPPDATPLPELEEINQDDGKNNESNNHSDSQPQILVQPNQKGKRLCRRCKSFKPQRAHHCSVCRRCIIKMDHHCPWVNNCVGIGNHKYFLLFVLYTFLSCVYSMSLVVLRFALCMQTNRLHDSSRHHLHPHGGGGGGGGACLDRPTDLISILGLVVEAVLFGLFTSCMMVDQWDVVMTNVTHIDRLKGDRMHDGTRRVAGVAEVFGLSKGRPDTAFRWDWISPFARACFPDSIRDEILGYCRPGDHGESKNGGATNHVEMGGPPSRMVRSVAEIV